MVIVAQVAYQYAAGSVTSGTWVQLQPVAGNGGSLSGGYLTGITPTGSAGGVGGLPNNTTSPSSGPYAMPAECTEFDVFDSSGATVLLGVGATASAVSQIAIIPPGGPAYPVKTGISKGSLTWVKTLNTSATGGELLIMFKHGRV